MACEWYFTGLGLLADLMISCMSEAMPDRATAAHYGDSMVSCFFSVDPSRGQWIAIEPTAGGWGARVDGDGESALINLVNGSFRNISAECTKPNSRSGWRSFALRRDSGGAGKWRGGCGVVRRFKLLESCFGALWFDRSLTTAGDWPVVATAPPPETPSASRMDPKNIPEDEGPRTAQRDDSRNQDRRWRGLRGSA